MTDDVGKPPLGQGIAKDRRLALLEMIAAGCWHPEVVEVVAGASFEDRAGFENKNSRNRRSGDATS